MPLTPTDILNLADPVALMYADVTSALLVNVAAHLKYTDDIGTRAWQLRKLSEMDALNKESVKIISTLTGKKNAEITRAITRAAEVSGIDVDATIRKAARAGFLSGTSTDVLASQNVQTVIKNYVGQAVKDTNLVNTVMLGSTMAQYQLAVAGITASRTQIESLLSAAGITDVQNALNYTQRVLNAATGRVLTGTTSMVQAVRQAITQLADAGITGFIDRAGHHWTPEAYVTMDVRTTVHNTAVNAQRQRAADHGVYTFQITSHAGARPLCAPYQGGIYSWDGSSGYVYSLDGTAYYYDSIYSTSYGEPAGIFGINCGHDPETFVDGYSTPRYERTPDEEENNRIYKLTQQQRAMERSVREWKTKAACYKAAGDDEAFRKAGQKVKEKTVRLNNFISDNGLTARPAATQVSTYNRSVAASVRAIK